jgi:CRP-like cAMP-binding protein
VRLPRHCARRGETSLPSVRHRGVGVLDTCRDGKSGRLGAGDTLAWDAMRDRGPYEATLRSVSAAHLLVMSHAPFRAAEALAPTERREYFA